MHVLNQHILTVVAYFCFGVFGYTYAQSLKETQLRQLYEQESNPRKKFMHLMELGEYYKTQNIRKADSLQPIILEESRNFEDSLRFNALFYSAEVAQLRGDNEEYFNKILECRSFLETLKSDEVIYKVYRHLGFYHSNMLENETADFYLRHALKIALKNRNLIDQSEINCYIGLNFMLQNHKDSAIYYTNQGIHLGRKSKNKAILAQAFNHQAKVHEFFGKAELSVARNLSGLKMATEAQNTYLMALFSREIGHAQISINLKDAGKYFQKSLNLSKQIHDLRQIGLTLTNISEVQLKRQQYASATKSATEAIKYLTTQKDLNGLGEAHNILGMIYKDQKQYDRAANNFNQALIFYEKNNNREQIASVYHNVGTVFQKQKRYENALNYLNRSIEIRERFGSKNHIYNTYRVISEVYKETNNLPKSLEYLQLYADYLDSNTAIQATIKIVELNEAYRAEEREQIISSQSESIELEREKRTYSDTKRQLQLSISVALFVIITLAGIIIFYRWKQTKIKQQHRESEMSQTLLRTQMNPHFVFNAMSVIQSYIYENDVENSTKFLVDFSRLMRLILENSSKEFIPISTEIEILRKYLETQKLRFEDRFHFNIESDPQLLEERCIIPPMITQPFIENSIEHGQLHTIEGGFIHVRFQREGNMLKITIEDNGIGRRASKQQKKSYAHKSMAMKITRDRINNLNSKYRTGGYLDIQDYDIQSETGTRVLISLPYRAELNTLN